MAYVPEINLARTQDSIYFSYDPRDYPEFTLEDKELSITIEPKVTTRVRSPYNGPENKDDESDGNRFAPKPKVFIGFKENEVTVDGVEGRFNLFSNFEKFYLTNSTNVVEVSKEEGIADVSMDMNKENVTFSIKQEQEEFKTMVRGETLCPKCAKVIPRSRMGQEIHDYDYH